MMLIFLILVLVFFLYEFWHFQGNYFKTVSRKISECLNVVFPHTLNRLFVKPNGYRFGQDGKRIVYVLDLNNRLKTLTPLALHVVKFFDFFNRGFLEKSIPKKDHVSDLDTYRDRVYKQRE